MEGRLPALPGEMPTVKDWENHLTTIFPEVRGAEAGSRGAIGRREAGEGYL